MTDKYILEQIEINNQNVIEQVNKNNQDVLEQIDINNQIVLDNVNKNDVQVLENINKNNEIIQNQIDNLKSANNELVPSVQNLQNEMKTVSTTSATKNGEITINILYFDENNNICSGNSLISDNGSNQFDSLVEAIDSLNNFIKINNIIYVSSVDIRLGSGITWVNEVGNRNYNQSPGDQYYSKSPRTQYLGRPETTITRLAITGFGQGTSTIIGSWLGVVYNLQLPPENIIEENDCDNLQLNCKLILNNLFWQGNFGLNVMYTDYDIETIVPPNSQVNYFDCSNNYYDISLASKDEISLFTDRRKVEVIITNMWVELNFPNKPIETSLEYPLFFLNIPALNSFFITQTNMTSYIKPDSYAKTYGTCVFFSQFVQGNPTDTFIQTCSFSTRIFGEHNYICLGIINNDKVSILNSQFNGQLCCKSDKLSLFGCYMLGIGPKEYDGMSTVNGVYMDKLDSFAVGHKIIGNRFICSSCEFVSSVYWGEEVAINNGGDVCKFLKNGGGDYKNVLDPHKVVKNPVLPWYVNHDNISVLFTNISFYMVNMEGKKFIKNNHFNLITLTNSIGTCDFSSSDSNTVSITQWGAGKHVDEL